MNFIPCIIFATAILSGCATVDPSKQVQSTNSVNTIIYTDKYRLTLFELLNRKKIELLNKYNNVKYANGYKDVAIYLRTERLKYDMKKELSVITELYTRDSLQIPDDDKNKEIKIFNDSHRELLSNYQKVWFAIFQADLEKNREFYSLEPIDKCKDEARSLSSAIVNRLGGSSSIVNSPIYKLYEECGI